MRILVVADFHGNLDSAKLLVRRRLELGTKVDTDIVAVCGDLSELGSIEKGLAVLSEVRKGFENVFYVTGNHDPPSLMITGTKVSHTAGEGSVQCLHGKVVKFRDFIFIGMSGFFPPFYGTWDIDGSPITREKEAFRFLDNLFEEHLRTRGSEQAKVVLVTHDPPYGVADLSVLTKTNAGSRGIREIILKWKPAIALCGHIHEGRSVERLGQTLIVNPGSMHFRQAAQVEVKNENATGALIKI